MPKNNIPEYGKEHGLCPALFLVGVLQQAVSPGENIPFIAVQPYGLLSDKTPSSLYNNHVSFPKQLLSAAGATERMELLRAENTVLPF